MNVLKKSLMAAAAVAGLGLVALKSKLGNGATPTPRAGTVKKRSKPAAPKSGARAKQRPATKAASKGRSAATKPRASRAPRARVA